MPKNVFDQAARFAVKLDPVGWLAWAFGLRDVDFEFRGWLDTRGVTFPGETDRTGDTVARLEHSSGTEPPWAIAVEFQIEPDSLMFGRMLVYLGNLWLAVKPDEECGSRFNVGALVVNLTGAGNASRQMEWPDAGLRTQLKAVEHNMATKNADDVLAGIEGGKWSRSLLPWIPLMTGGADGGIIERWKKLAECEPNYHRRSDHAMLARVFADAADSKLIWDLALERWNVKESSLANELIAEGRIEQAVTSLIAVLEAKYGRVQPELEATLRACRDLGKLQTWLTQATKSTTLEEFKAIVAS
jgi:hypothetical protein